MGDTILHELAHSFDDCRSGHKGRWRRWALTLGIALKDRPRTPECVAMIEQALREVGIPAAHVVTKLLPKRAKSSQVRYECPVCHRHAHVPLALADGGFSLACVDDQMIMVRRVEGV